MIPTIPTTRRKVTFARLALATLVVAAASALSGCSLLLYSPPAY
jgi:hypothetical protein